MTIPHPDPSFIDVEFLGHPGVIGTGVLRSDHGVWLVDPGPSTGLAGLQKGLATLGASLADVRGLLLTHIHLDHAGASGTIVRQRPEIRVFVHERGAPHMIDPSRLLESAGRLYAGDLGRLWGEVAPVPAANVQVLKGGERLDVDGRHIDVLYTPGHASHHVSYFDAHTGSAFVGDTGGIRLAPASPPRGDEPGARAPAGLRPRPAGIVPPTPPPDIDLQAWSESIARIRGWNATRLYLTHYGAVDRPHEHLAALEEQLCACGEIARGILAEPGSDEDHMTRFVERATADLRRAMPEEEARRYELAVPFEHCWLGLARYWRKKGR